MTVTCESCGDWFLSTDPHADTCPLCFRCEDCGHRAYECQCIPDCPLCGGSGGGDEPALRCQACSGTGLARRPVPEPKEYE